MLMTWTTAINSNIRLYIWCARIRWDRRNTWERLCVREQRLSYFGCHKGHDQYLCSRSRLASCWFSAASCHRSTWVIGLLAGIHKPPPLILHNAAHNDLISRLNAGQQEDVWKPKSGRSILQYSYCRFHALYRVCCFPFNRYQKMQFCKQTDTAGWQGCCQRESREVGLSDKSYEIGSVTLKWTEVK